MIEDKEIEGEILSITSEIKKLERQRDTLITLKNNQRKKTGKKVVHYKIKSKRNER